MKEEIEINQGFVEQDTALESMGASDFDCYSAYGEVIDNSIQAFATDIRIFIEERKDRQNTRSKKIVGGIFALILLCFLFFFPLFTGQVITYEDWNLRMWFNSWI